MQEEYITFDTAKLAKEKGFNEPVNKFFKIRGISEGIIEEDNEKLQSLNNIADTLFARPTQASLQRWLRESHNIDISIITEEYGTYKMYKVNIYKGVSERMISKTLHKLPDMIPATYEETLELGLQEALKLIKI